MKKLFMSYLLLLTIMLSVAKAGDEIPSIAVLDFRANSGVSNNEVLMLSETFRSEFSKTKKYSLVSRGEMVDIFKEQEFNAACSSSECAVEAGHMLQSDMIISGDIGMVGKKYNIVVKLLDVATGKIVKIESERFEGAKEDLFDKMDVLAQKMGGTYKESSNFWWYAGGAAIVGAGAYLFYSNNAGESESTSEGIGTPPGNPK